MLALHQGFEVIRSGQAEAAIVGGVNLLLKPTESLGLHRLGMLNPDGACKVFDEDGKEAKFLITPSFGTELTFKSTLKVLIRRYLKTLSDRGYIEIFQFKSNLISKTCTQKKIISKREDTLKLMAHFPLRNGHQSIPLVFEIISSRKADRE